MYGTPIQYSEKSSLVQSNLKYSLNSVLFLRDVFYLYLGQCWVMESFSSHFTFKIVILTTLTFNTDNSFIPSMYYLNCQTETLKKGLHLVFIWCIYGVNG